MFWPVGRRNCWRSFRRGRDRRLLTIQKVGADLRAAICGHCNHRRPEADSHFEDTSRGLARDTLWRTTLLGHSVRSRRALPLICYTCPQLRTT
jgi:hypothetical protein